jgi:hypothetical protein
MTHFVYIHLVDRHLVGKHLADIHFVNRHLVDRHLVDRHLVDRHLVDRHLVDRHLVVTALTTVNLMMVFKSLINTLLTKCLSVKWFLTKRRGADCLLRQRNLSFEQSIQILKMTRKMKILQQKLNDDNFPFLGTFLQWCQDNQQNDTHHHHIYHKNKNCDAQHDGT